jgi:hypothetical protein
VWWRARSEDGMEKEGIRGEDGGGEVRWDEMNERG